MIGQVGRLRTVSLHTFIDNKRGSSNRCINLVQSFSFFSFLSFFWLKLISIDRLFHFLHRGQIYNNLKKCMNSIIKFLFISLIYEVWRTSNIYMMKNTLRLRAGEPSIVSHILLGTCSWIGNVRKAMYCGLVYMYKW